MKGKVLFRYVLTFCFVCSPIFAAAQQTEADLKRAHLAVLKTWLKSKPALRLALEKDYDKEALDYFRQENANVLPFYVAKDFNGDRKEDFAVILTNKTGKKKFAVAVFNAPLDSQKARQPAFFTDKIESGDILYFNPNTKRLLVGPYASDAGFALEPSGKSYKVKFFGD